jgi:IS30 family transposase
MTKRYEHLSPEERERINLFRAEGKSLREIGRLLGRSDATIGRELKLNAPPTRQGRYLAHKTQERYRLRQIQAHSRPRLKNPTILSFVEECLRKRLSPELIAGRLPLERQGYSISHEAILPGSAPAHLQPDLRPQAAETEGTREASQNQPYPTPQGG